MKPKCTQCGKPTDHVFHEESGGLCGICLADYALPLMRVGNVERDHDDGTPIVISGDLLAELFDR